MFNLISYRFSFGMVDENGVKIDPSHLYIIGFWSMGGKPIVIANITLAD